MTAVFSSWETDPFFAAATEVQESADRMELAYRNWLYKRALAGERTADERSVNHASVSKRGQVLPRSTSSSSWQDVTVALDTTKWQLEEFEKAVTDLAQRNASGLGEDVSQRHFSFIGAIQNQIGLIEDMLHKCIDTQCLNTSHLVKLNAEERDQLEVFLSGCSFHPKKENSSSRTSFQTYAPASGLKKSVDSRFMSGHYNSRVFGVSSSSKQHIGDGCKSELHSCLEVVKASSVPLERPNTIRSLQEGLHGIGKLQSSTNGFRRWTKGSNHMDINKDSTFLWKDKLLPDIEEGVLPEISRSKRQSSLRSAVGWNLGRLVISCNEAAHSSFRLQRAAVVVVVLCLCCMYFWFLSSLVPYVNNAIPSFQD